MAGSGSGTISLNNSSSFVLVKRRPEAQLTRTASGGSAATSITTMPAFCPVST